jgi:predicted acetyltransferase
LVTAYVVVLGRGLAGEKMDDNSKERVHAALIRIRKLLACGIPVGGLVFAAGTGKDRSAETMASGYAWYASRCTSYTSPQEMREVRMLVNEANHAIWGTVREMLWAKEVILGECPNARIEFVTNKTHARRAWVANKLITKIPNCRFIHSLDDQPRWYHEILGYLKLLAYMVGLEDIAERFRREHWAQ